MSIRDLTYSLAAIVLIVALSTTIAWAIAQAIWSIIQ